MRMNTRFTVAIHEMALLALGSIKYPDVSITSELIAKSINTNPVVIRRITSMLKKAGLVDVRAGVGGATLTRAPQDITLLDIYHAVKTSQDDMMFDVHENPNDKCFVGAYILDAVTPPLMNAQKALENSLASATLLDVIRPIAEKNQIELT